MNRIYTLCVWLLAVGMAFATAALDLPRRMLGTQIDLMTPLVIAAALAADRRTMIGVAVAGGLSMDTLSATPLGLSVPPLAAVGLLAHRQLPLMLPDQKAVQWLLGLAGGLLAPTLSLLSAQGWAYFSGSTDPLAAPSAAAAIEWGWIEAVEDRELPLTAGWVLWRHVPFMAVGSAFLTPLMYGLLRRLGRAIEYPLVKPPYYRPDREMKRGRM
ncbi:MAG TPA: hypothetical protein P5555_18480 [Candidatus Paceibacterota bacterium]|nr:hypothetical protein [Verrucomicrobiota bacterium]HRZ47171.1 hypothetical protein [Candidatus Paceibacterota bacterium]HRZ93041.1 hypothetical protein [Candidatus Paceibacterota bacterium]